MRKVCILAFMATLPLCTFGALNEQYVAYIEQWKEVAEQQQLDYGIPACITLAQGLLESGAGQSELAKNANNHFGIKCSGDWMGDVYRYDDDARGECFRVYLDAAESFKDHSLFLQKDRYKTLYEIPVSDYKAWAYRLRECGYATDPLYAQKLIKIIEDYGLCEKIEDTTPNKEETNNKAKKAVMVTTTPTIAVLADNPNEAEWVEPRTAHEERQLFLLQHITHKMNGKKYVIAQEGDTYENIAFRLNKRERQLREWNDALGRTLQPGERVYLAKKASKGIEGHESIWVHPNETLWEISQREGIQIDKIRQYNGLDKRIRVFFTRQQLLLVKPKK